MEQLKNQFTRTQQGEKRESFEETVHRYYKPLFGYVYSRIKDYQTSEDITQETFLRAYQKGGHNDVGWLFTIAKNCCMEWFRTNQKTRPYGVLNSQPASPPGGFVKDEKVESITKKDEMVKGLHQALERLPEQYYLILAMKYQNGLSCQQIAQTLGQPIGTVTSTLARAYELLRRKMGGKNEV